MAKGFTVGALRHRITIQSLARTTDDQGGFTDVWSDVATVWADVKPVSSRERLYASQIEYQRSHKVVLRYITGVTSGITNTHRFTFNGRTFQIKGVRLLDEKKFWMILDAEENQGT